MNAIKPIKTIAIVVFALLAAYEAQGQNAHEKLTHFLKVAEELRQQQGVPGVGLAIVYENKILHTGGLGFRDLEERAKVTENTLFSIGSNTKPFTGLLATKLVYRGLLEWDEPLVRYIPELKFKQEYITDNVTLADALAHRVGLERRVEFWKNRNLTRAELLARLDELDFDSAFRNSFNYSNLMYVVAGVATERVTETSWEDLVQKEIFDPLGMNDSRVTMADFLASEQRAIGYHNDGIRRAAPVDLTSIAPAGAIYSTAKDMGQWIKMLVDNGRHEGSEFLSKEEYDYMLRPHANLSIRNGDELWYYYTGLGGYSKNDKRTLGANGKIDGQNSRCELKLDEGFGIFVMTNKVSDYKDLLTKYATKIFLDNDYSRDELEESKLAQQAGFQKFVTRLLDFGIVSASKEYDGLQWKPAESNMNQLGYELLTAGQTAKAIFVFQLNTKSYPESANVFDSLAEAYMGTGQLDLAEDNYKKSISLDPENENAKAMLEKINELRKKTS